MAIAMPLDWCFEFYLGAALGWVETTTDVHEPAGVVLSRGGASESDRPPPQKCAFTLDNVTGNYSPRNANGPYFGFFGQNTPFRLTYRRAIDTANRTVSNGWGTNDTGQAWTSDLTTGGAVAGDFNVTPGALKHTVQGTNLFRNSYLATSTHENIDVQVDFKHSVTAPVTGASINAGIILRGTSTTAYYGAWLQASSVGTMRVVLVDQNGLIIAGPTDIAGLTYAANTVYRLRAQIENNTLRVKAWLPAAGEPYAWQLSGHDESISGLGWVGLTSGTSAGNTNTKPYTTTYSNFIARNPRYSGELSDIDVDWQESENTIHALIKAAGIRRRLGQGSSPLDSTLRRGNLYATPTPVAYWPAEDDKGSTVIASGLTGGRAMAISGTVTLAANSSFAASKALPQLQACYWDGLINPYTVPSPNAMQLRWLMIAPSSSPLPDASYIIDLHNTGTAGLWRVMFGTGGSLRLQVWSNAFTGGADLLDTGAVAFNVNGKLLLCSLELTQSGANVNYNLATLEVGQTVGAVTSGTLNSVTIGTASRVFVDPLKVCNGLVIGHIAVHPAVTSLFQLSSELNAFTGETAGTRMQRLCTQRGVPFSYMGDLTATPAMGAQLPNDLVALLDECADVDMGVLFEPAGEIGFEYRTRGSMLNQSVTIDLDYAQGHVQPGFKPVDNDEKTRNDIKLSRQGGSSVRATLDVGAKSTLEPSAGGVGRYDAQQTVNPQTDEQLTDLAYWMLWLFTVNEARYPEIEVELGNDQMLNAGKIDAALATSIADRLTVSNPPAKHCSDQISQLVRGYVERAWPFRWVLTFNGVPASPYEVVTDSNGPAISNDTTTLTGGPGGSYSSSATSLQFASTGDLWTTSAGEYPVDVKLNGEVMRVTAMAGAASPQTATVTRSINGVVKSQANGTAVKLARPATPG